MINPRKFTFEFVKQMIESDGYTLLSDEYVKATIPIKLKCPRGHEISMRFGNFKAGHRCQICFGKKLHDYEFVKEYVENFGYTMLSDKYEGAFKKLNMLCPDGHEVSITWDNFRAGKRCRACKVIQMQGENHPRWNSNLTQEEREIGRNYPGYSNWRSSVYERDDFTCQICETRGGALHAHHVFNYANYSDLRLNVSNGITLCQSCHEEFHREFGRTENDPVQLIKFLKSKWENRQEESA